MAAEGAVPAAIVEAAAADAAAGLPVEIVAGVASGGTVLLAVGSWFLIRLVPGAPANSTARPTAVPEAAPTPPGTTNPAGSTKLARTKEAVPQQKTVNPTQTLGATLTGTIERRQVYTVQTTVRSKSAAKPVPPAKPVCVATCPGPTNIHSGPLANAYMDPFIRVAPQYTTPAIPSAGTETDPNATGIPYQGPTCQEAQQPGTVCLGDTTPLQSDGGDTGGGDGTPVPIPPDAAAGACDQVDNGQPDLYDNCRNAPPGADCHQAGSGRTDRYDASQNYTCTLGESAGELPELRIDKGQFGTKWGRHARDYNLDPSDPKAREWFLRRIAEVREHPDDIRRGAWNPHRGGGYDYFFFRQGSDLLLTKGDGEFVTMFPGENNKWYLQATPWGAG
jgi:hypothetical protein